MLQRIDKIISSSGTLSRREVHRLISGGRVCVNGGAVRRNDFKCDPERDSITVCGEDIGYRKKVYIMMNKPAGVLSASNDKSRETVASVAEKKTGRRGLFPVGRLDKDTTGLIILTDDGEYAHKVISPKSHISKVYIAELDGPVTGEMTEKFREGITLADGALCRPAGLRVLGSGSTAEVVISEGKYHQIKRMFGVVGLGVNGLCRVKIGGLELDSGLAEGECRFMNEDEAALALESGEKLSAN